MNRRRDEKRRKRIKKATDNDAFGIKTRRLS
jgi:hypothetical protein